MHRAVREDEISVKKNESVTILSSNLSRGYLVHRPPTSQVVLTIRNHPQRLAFRVLLQKAGSPPIVFISQGRRQGNLPRGPSGLRLACLLWTLIVLTYLLWTGFESKASVDKEEAVRHHWTLDFGEQEIMIW